MTALTIVAFALRLSQLHQSLVGDEVSTYQDVVGHSFATVLTTVHKGAENSPPLYFLLAWFSAKLGDPSVLIRLPSLVLGAGTVPLVYAIGRATVGRVGGLIGAAAVALTPFAVYYGIEARPYATMTFFVALSTLAVVRASRTRSTLWWLLYVLSATAAAYSHYTSIFVLAVQGAWSLWACRDRAREPLIANGLVCLLYLPWLPHLRGKGLSVIGSLYPLGAHRVLSDLLRPIPGHPSAPLSAIPSILGLIAVGSCLLLGLTALALRWRATSRRGDALRLPPQIALIAMLAAATPLGLLLYSVLATDLWLPRGLSASLPATALLLGALLGALPRWLAGVSIGVLVITMVGGTLRSFDVAYARGPYRTIAADLDRVAGPRNPVTIISWLGSTAIPAQSHRSHLVLSSANMWQSARGQGDAYLVLDNQIARMYKIGTPTAQGFRLISRKHYAGGFPTDVLTYRRLR